MATRLKSQILPHRNLLVQYVANKQIASEAQLNAAMEYFLQNPSTDVNVPEMEEAAGIGVTITPEQIEQAVEGVVTKYKVWLISV